MWMPHDHFPPGVRPRFNEIHWHLTKTRKDAEPPSKSIDFAGLTVRKFKEAINDLLIEEQTLLHVPLAAMANNHDLSNAVEWTYMVTEKHDDIKTHMWKIKTRGDTGVPSLFDVLKHFGSSALVTVTLKMDMPNVPMYRFHVAPHPWTQIPPFEVGPENATSPIATQTQGEGDFTLHEFLRFCFIPDEDIDVWEVLRANRIHHWSALKGVSKEELHKLGFAFGPTRLIFSGVLRAQDMLDQQ